MIYILGYTQYNNIHSIIPQIECEKNSMYIKSQTLPLPKQEGVSYTLDSRK